jgi:glutamate decarboxylase
MGPIVSKLKGDDRRGKMGAAAIIGNTPLLNLSRMSKTKGVTILAKAEYLNPSGSIKDRIAQHIIDCAERDGKLKPGDTLVASTSGNTGAAVAMVAAIRGYGYIAITNAKCSQEKRDSMAAYGGKLIVAKDGLAADHPEHYVNLEATLCERNANYFPVNQYENPDNPDAYYRTLGPEIWNQTKGRVTHFIAGGSTGGTVSGTGKYLKEASKDQVKVLMPDPVGSVMYGAYHGDGKPVERGVLAAGKYNVEGVGKDSVPGTMNFGVVDAMLSVTDKQCFDMCLRLSREEGLLTGGSSGLNMHAAVELSGRCNPGATIVVVLPDSGIKYLSKIYSPEWRKSKGFGGDSEDEEREPAGEGDEREPSRVATPDPDADPQTATNVERVTEALGVPRVASALKLELKDERRASIDDIDASSQNLNLLVDAQMEDVADAIDPAAEGDSETASNE